MNYDPVSTQSSNNTDSVFSQLQPKACKVCSVETKEIHYFCNICNSCKVFFRRKVCSGKTYKCKYNNDCDLAFKPNKCKACRMKMCLEIGMKPEVVIKCKQKSKSAQSTFEVEKSDRMDDSLKAIVVAKQLTSCVLSPRIIRDDVLSQYFLNSLCYTETKFQKFREKLYHNPHFVDMNINELFRKECELGKFGRESLKSFFRKSSPSICDVQHQEKVKNYKHRLYDGCFLVLDWAKTIPFFTNMSICDQMEVIKFSGISIMLADNCFFCHINNYSTATYSDNYIPILTYPHPIPALVIDVCTTIVTMYRRLKPTIEEHSIIKILLLCCINQQNISDEGRKTLVQEKDTYSLALQQNLMRSGNGSQMSTRYCEILGMIGTFFHFGNKFKEYFKLQVLLSIENFRKINKPMPKIQPFLEFTMD